MKNRFFYIFSLVVFAFPALAQADVEATMQKCNDCHGDNGVSQWDDVPTIAGLAEFVHIDALFVYQEEARPCAESEFRQGDTSRAPTTMCAIAQELSEEDIEAIAAAYAELPYASAKQEFDADLAAAGEAIHSKNCDRCHSDAGMNAEDEAGILGGQWTGYLRKTFAEYAAGEREQPKKMQEKLEGLSADDIEALLNYYAAQQ